jgi:hypothetical protein
MTIKKVGSLEASSIFDCETNQCRDFSTQASRFYDNPSCVSCFFVGTLPYVYQPKKRPWSPSIYWSFWVNMNMQWKKFWIQKSIIANSNILFISMGMMWANTFGNLLVTYQMSWRRCISFINNIQTSPSSFFVELVTKKGRMSWMPMPWSSFIWMFIHDL